MLFPDPSAMNWEVCNFSQTSSAMNREVCMDFCRKMAEKSYILPFLLQEAKKKSHMPRISLQSTKKHASPEIRVKPALRSFEYNDNAKSARAQVFQTKIGGKR